MLLNEILTEDEPRISINDYNKSRGLPELNACWIMPDGNILLVEFMGHADTYLEYLEKHDPSLFKELHKDRFNEFRISNEAKKRGWIRYAMDIAGGNFSHRNYNFNFISSFQTENFTRITAKTCLKILYNNKKYQKMGVEISSEDDRFGMGIGQMIPYADAITFFRSITGITEGYDPPPCGYPDMTAYWIMPNGEILPIRDSDDGHAGAYLEYLKKNNSEAYYYTKPFRNDEHQVSGMARNNGWIRYMICWVRGYPGADPKIDAYTSAQRHYVSTFEYTKISPITARACLKLLYNTKKYQPMMVEISVPYKMVPYAEAIKYFRSIK